MIPRYNGAQAQKMTSGAALPAGEGRKSRRDFGAGTAVNSKIEKLPAGSKKYDEVDA